MSRITLTAKLNLTFSAIVTAEVDADGEVTDIEVHSASTGENLTTLLEGSPAWDQAWSAAERHMLAQPVTRKARRAMAANVASMCHDTPHPTKHTCEANIQGHLVDLEYQTKYDILEAKDEIVWQTVKVLHAGDDLTDCIKPNILSNLHREVESHFERRGEDHKEDWQ